MKPTVHMCGRPGRNQKGRLHSAPAALKLFVAELRDAGTKTSSRVLFS